MNDIVNRLTLWAARQPRSDGAQLALEAAEHIEALRREILQHINVRNVLLDMGEPPSKVLL